MTLLTYYSYPQSDNYAKYGIVSSTGPSSDDESEDKSPRASLEAPIEALQGLANAAAELAAAPSSESQRWVNAKCPILISSPRSSLVRGKKRKRSEPIPRNAFAHVVEKVANQSILIPPHS